MMDIFSSFDIATLTTSILPMISWGILLLLLPLFSPSLWLSSSSQQTFSPALNTMFEQQSRTFGNNLKYMSSFLIPLFILLIATNLSGLIPYMFSFSSHLIFTLSFGLPLWLSLILSGATHNPVSFTAHLLPAGAPWWLNPFLVIVETISILVRPITLSFRLAANMSAGHIVMGLLGIYASSAFFVSSSSFITLMLIQIFYFIFEMGISLIQAFIFCLLITLYSDDHP